jgi:Fe2+ or Zn2+ uptake regulation protein
MFPTGMTLAGSMMRMSQLRKRILAALPVSPDAPVPTGKVMERMGISKPSNIERAVISRALARLAELGLVRRRRPEVRRAGHGNLWSRAVPMTAGDRAARA